MKTMLLRVGAGFVACTFISACGGSNNNGSLADTTQQSSENTDPPVAFFSGASISSNSSNNCDESALPAVEGLPPTGTGSATLGDATATFDGALFDEIFPGQFELLLHDGEARVIEQTGCVVWGVFNSSFGISLELSMAGDSTLPVGTFEVSDNGSSSAEQNRLVDGYGARDLNGSGTFDIAGEYSFIIAGQVTVTGSAPDWSITVDVTLENGAILTARYDGDYNVLP